MLVLLNGSALSINWAAENIPSIVEAWYPGQAGGDAIADVLFGDHNPGGRLPITFYRSLDDLPPFEDYSMDSRTYRYFNGDPLFPFGYGLSFTSFAYRNLQMSTQVITPEESITITADVQNIGSRAGDEVVQCYISDVFASVPVPIRQLQGFSRIHLKPGETQTVAFTLKPSQMSLIDDAGQRVIEPGEFRISIGGRQPVSGDFLSKTSDILCGTFQIAG